MGSRKSREVPPAQVTSGSAPLTGWRDVPSLCVAAAKRPCCSVHCRGVQPEIPPSPWRRVMFPGNCFSLSFLCWLVCLDRAIFAPHRGQVRIYPGAKASPGLSKNLQVLFLSPSGRLHFLDSFAKLQSHLCCSGSLSWCSYVTCFPPSSPCVLSGNMATGILFCRWIWNQFCSRLVGKLSTSVKRLPCEPSACTVG